MERKKKRAEWGLLKAGSKIANAGWLWLVWYMYGHGREKFGALKLSFILFLSIECEAACELANRESGIWSNNNAGDSPDNALRPSSHKYTAFSSRHF